MIARLWHGRTSIENTEAYTQFMIARAAPDYGAVEGLQKRYFFRRREGDVAHFLLLTFWDSLEAVKKFAGDNPERAKYYPEDDSFLLEKETKSVLYELFHEE